MTIIPELERQLFAAADKLLPIPLDREPPLAAGSSARSGSGASRFRRGTRLAIAALAVLAAAGTVAAAGAALNLFSAASGMQVHAGTPTPGRPAPEKRSRCAPTTTSASE